MEKELKTKVLNISMDNSILVYNKESDNMSSNSMTKERFYEIENVIKENSKMYLINNKNKRNITSEDIDNFYFEKNFNDNYNRIMNSYSNYLYVEKTLESFKKAFNNMEGENRKLIGDIINIYSLAFEERSLDRLLQSINLLQKLKSEKERYRLNIIKELESNLSKQIEPLSYIAQNRINKTIKYNALMTF